MSMRQVWHWQPHWKVCGAGPDAAERGDFYRYLPTGAGAQSLCCRRRGSHTPAEQGPNVVEQYLSECGVLGSILRCSLQLNLISLLLVAGCLKSKQMVADLPTWPYLAVFVWKLAGSMDVRAYFSKYRQRVSRKYRNHHVNECKFVASKVVRWLLMELSLVDICIFQTISVSEVFDRSWLVQ